MTELLLVRHGETDWNRDRRIQGHTDIPLNAAGLEQAQALAERLAETRLDAVYASDLARARDTAQTVADRHGIEVQVDGDLREKNFGSWEGLTDTEIGQRFPDAVRGRWGDGETTEQMAERAVAAVGRIRARHNGERVLVVTHGGTLRAILGHLEVEHGPIGNCDVFAVVC
jgi:2,3-bisphosphoglycerate-dependent phosphoglycerate mutase